MMHEGRACSALSACAAKRARPIRSCWRSRGSNISRSWKGSRRISQPRLSNRSHQFGKKRNNCIPCEVRCIKTPVDADIPHQEIFFLDETDPMSSPMKAKGVAELGICGVAAAVANAVYNATGVRVRDYPITLDKLLDFLPEEA